MSDLDEYNRRLAVEAEQRCKKLDVVEVVSRVINGSEDKRVAESVGNNPNVLPVLPSVPSAQPTQINEKVAPVKTDMKESLFSKFGQGKVTVDQNVHELGIADDNIGMKSDINDPMVMSVWELVGERAASKGYPKTADVYKKIARFMKVNMVSHRRMGRKEMTDILTARRLDEMQSGVPEPMGDKLLGKRDRR